MELWIRSQDKNILQKTNALFISHTNENVWSICDNRNLTKYGEYKSKERALEVLDEIQKLIAGKIVCNFNGMYKPEDMKNKMQELGIVGLYADVSYDIQQLGNCIVYEMPKE